MFLNKKISDIHLRFLILICDKKNRTFQPWNQHPPNIIQISIIPDFYNEELLNSDKNSIPRDKIAEFAAVGHIFCYILKIRPDISDIEVLNPPDEGFDFIFNEKGSWKKVEISGVNSNKDNTFKQRISTKRIKFANRSFKPPIPTEQLIGIVDFNFMRYTFWDISQSQNYID